MNPSSVPAIQSTQSSGTLWETGNSWVGTIHGAVQKLSLSDHEAMRALGQQHWSREIPGTSHFCHQRFPAPRAIW